MAELDHITCHVLNTHNGAPAANLRCKLAIDSIQHTNGFAAQSFTATTDANGRVSTWASTEARGGAATVNQLLEEGQEGEQKDSSKACFRCTLRIEGVDDFYRSQGVDSFWPEIEVKFLVAAPGSEGWRHYHVPVLLGPWSYSTYRGS